MKREKLSSRLGFILLSAGCAIGLGNIWRFPYMVGEYGGGAFVLVYLFFLIVLGLPIIVMEYSVGRASKKSIAQSFQLLEKKGQKWHWFSYVAMIGNYLLVMFYTTISGWMLAYFVKMLKGDFTGLTTVEVGKVFTDLQADPMASIFWMILVVVIGCLICVDRCGFVGADGPTHHGVFDLGILNPLPNVIICTPSNSKDAKKFINTYILCPFIAKIKETVTKYFFKKLISFRLASFSLFFV